MLSESQRKEYVKTIQEAEAHDLLNELQLLGRAQERVGQRGKNRNIVVEKCVMLKAELLKRISK